MINKMINIVGILLGVNIYYFEDTEALTPLRLLIGLADQISIVLRILFDVLSAIKSFRLLPSGNMRVAYLPRVTPFASRSRLTAHIPLRALEPLEVIPLRL